MTSDLASEPTVTRLKCVVWDLDETLWHGRLLDGDEPTLREGAREVVAELDRRGILQSVASTNLHEHAWPWLERFGLDRYMVAPEIHMGAKHRSLKRIAGRLQLGLDGIAFIDDDPMERCLVRALLPAVTVLDAAEYRGLTGHPRLEPAVVTPEGRDRRRMVQAELQREEARQQHDADATTFLRTCNIRFRGRIANSADLDRVVELSERTNRMNATGSRHDATELATALSDPDQKVVVASMRDRFGDYGTVAAAVVASTHEEAVVEGLWMSCRAGKRGLPAAFFTYLAHSSNSAGAGRLVVRYRRSDLNRLAALHLGTYGFELVSRDDGDVYILPLPEGIRPFDDWLEVTV